MPTELAHLAIPVTGEGKRQIIHDQVSDQVAKQKRAYGGDKYKEGIYERPFTQEEMVYLPYLDLSGAVLQRSDPEWVYVTLRLVQAPPAADEAPAAYGVELDTDLDDNGDYIIWAVNPQGYEWDAGIIQIVSNADKDVGGDGYETIFSDLQQGIGDDPDLAWGRLSLEDSHYVEIAFKNSLIGGEKGKFLWRAWSSGLALTNDLFHPSDHFPYDLAGSPLKEEGAFYPLKAVHSLDNTCRVASGFDAGGKEKGLCPLAPEEGPEREDKFIPSPGGNPPPPPLPNHPPSHG